MQLILAVTVGLLMACGIYLALRRDVMFVALGLGLMGSAINLLILVVGRVHGAPALSLEGALGEQTANPLPQAFVLTAIVIGFAVVTLVLALGRRADLRGNTTKVDVQSAETAQASPSN